MGKPSKYLTVAMNNCEITDYKFKGKYSARVRYRYARLAKKRAARMETTLEKGQGSKP